MSIRAAHRGISYQVSRGRSGAWLWSFAPPSGKPCTGRVMGEPEFATIVVRRAIDVWLLMNPGVAIVEAAVPESGSGLRQTVRPAQAPPKTLAAQKTLDEARPAFRPAEGPRQI
jgi:hypothetical protein